jgi:hypothetical protein
MSGPTPPSADGQKIVDDMRKANLESLALTQQINTETQKFQTQMNGLNAAREAQTAAFNAVNRATEQIQSR